MLVNASTDSVYLFKYLVELAEVAPLPAWLGDFVVGPVSHTSGAPLLRFAQCFLDVDFCILFVTHLHFIHTNLSCRCREQGRGLLRLVSKKICRWGVQRHMVTELFDVWAP